jgi:hypothetical protein
MKKLFYGLLLLLLLAFISSNATTTVTVIGGSTSVCTKGAAVMTDVADDAGASWGNGKTIGQSFSYASGWQLHSIDIHMADLTDSNCVFDIKIGPDTSLGDDAYETWTGQGAAGGHEIITITSIDNDSFSASTTYYVGFMETTSDCRVQYDTGNEYGGGQYYNGDGAGWTLGTPFAGRDLDIQVYKCQ